MDSRIVSYVFIFAYFAALVLVGLGVCKWVRNSSDFLVSGRELHWIVLGAGVTAIYVAGSSVSTQPGLAYNFGVGSLIYVFSMATGQLLNYWIMIKTARRSGAYTMAEWFEMRCGVSSRMAAGIGFLFAYIPVTAAQFIGCAVIMSQFTGASYPTMIMIIGVFTVAYITLGGLWSTAVSDSIQMVIMIVALLILVPLIMVSRFGSFGEVFAQVSPEMMRMPFGTMPVFCWTLPSVSTYMFFLMIGVAIPAQHYWGRMAAARNEKNLKRAWIFQYLLSVPFVIVLTVVGLYALVGNPNLADPDSSYAFVISGANPILAGIVLVAIIAATQSTAAADINAGVTVYIRDLYKRFFKPDATEKQVLFASRMCTIAYGFVCILFSLWWSYGAAQAMACFTSFTFAIFPALMGSLFLKKPCNEAATISIVLALCTSLYWGIFTTNFATIAHTVWVTVAVGMGSYLLITALVRATGPWWKAKADPAELLSGEKAA